MATISIILGKSGSGKSTSLRNFNPYQVALIQVIRKSLPFPGARNWNPFVTDNYATIIAACVKAAKGGKRVIVIDDYQYVLANEFMRRNQEKGYDKFNDIGRHTWDVFDQLMQLPDEVRIYILSHTEETDTGQIKMKTIGKMLDDKITLEGLVTIVLRAVVVDGQHYFATKNNGSDTVKAPMGLFEDDLIDNDLAAVDEAIVGYYGFNDTTSQEAA